MALQTDLNVFPYHDDYNPEKNFYRVLFKPGVAVQARELNQLQTILQNQIEKFGDNIFKRGTIIEGCNISRHDVLPYVKIKDTETDGTQIAVTAYEGMTVRNSSNVIGYVVKAIAGFESRSPDLNTIYVKYNSSGNDSNTSTFAAGDTLTVFSPLYPIFKTRVNNGSSLFSNTDSVVMVSALAVQNSTGGKTFPGSAWVAGQTIQNGVANLVIVEANTTANTDALILKVRPLAGDLLTANTTKWRFGAGETIRNITTANTANVISVVGSGAAGSLVTDALGKITDISIIGQGTGYYVEPHVTVMKMSTSALSATEIGDLDVAALNYMATVTTANSSLSPVGTGYGVTVDEGTIYQKGFFSRVSSQLVVVNKYSNTGFTKSVGFYTAEDITDSNEDTSLLDNATGTYNYAAPGADRLKLTPELRVLDKQVADANTDFLPIIEFADGRPYKQNQGTVYNIIGDQIAQRTYEESGNYVLDTFTVTTHDSPTFSETPAVFKIDIDPGKAYINGYRVETGNYRANVAKGIATDVNNAAKIRLGFGNFYRVKELGGNFAFNIGASVDIQSAAATYITTSAGTTIVAPGTKIGEARIRSLTLESGQPGTANAVYRLYLFDITWSAGKNAGDARSIYYGGTNKGIADVVIGDAGRAVLEDAGVSSLLYNSVPAMKSVSNISYTYRTVNETETANTTGYIELNLGAGEFFPYSGALNDSGKRELLVVPKADYQASANAAGTISIGNSSTANLIVTGAGGADFLNAFNSGDFVKFANSSGLNPVIRQISQVTGASSMILTAGPGQTYSGGSATLYFPANVPISLTNKAARYANVSVSNSQVMTIYLANNIANSIGSSSSANVMVVYNATRNNVSSSVKTANRSVHTRIVCSNNSGLLTGPWALGLSDAFRMRKVYQANGVSRAQSFNANTGMTGSGTGNAFILMGSNKFANGDSVVYSNTGMITGITGLTNAGTYYAVYANSTGMALASTRGGANLTLTATATSESHTLTGEAIFFTGNTSGVSDITNDFYIDTNQKEDYLDTSYLYRKPGKPALAANTVLLVQYDVFTGGDASVKTISSYTIDDSLGFNALSAQAKVHTMEIPEILGVGNRYYDLRDQYDFRPRSANTINLITDISSVAAGANALSIINPTEPSSASRFTAAEKYFPAPDTDLTANIEFYLGRTDRVVVDSNGQFVVRAGKNGNANYIPPEPKNSLTLQLINIPAYPSLPEARSADMMKIIDTKVANEVYGKRIKKYTVTNLISATDRSRIQVKGYKMADVASLEKRIKDLEYYVSFTLAEALTRSRFIPSSADSLMDRFRFGFFVDPFTDYNYSDIGNPEFYATIGDNQLSPRLTELNIEFKPEDNSTGIITLPFNEFTIISQNDATDGAVIVVVDTGTSTTTTTTPTDTPTTTPTITETSPIIGTGPGTVVDTSGSIITAVITQSTAIILQSERSTSRNDNGSVYEEFLYTFSSLSGPAEFYINSRDNNIALEVFQSTAEGGEYITTYTSASALPITVADVTAKSLSLNGGRKIENLGELRRKSYGPVGGFLEDQFKLLWTHNPNDGIYYKIRVYKGSNHGGQGRSGTYGFKLYYPSDSVSTETRIVPNVANFDYTGIVHSVNPPEFTITLSTQYIDIGYGTSTLAYVADAQKFVINVTGLKPNTYHKFMFAGEDRTNNCSQSRSSTTNTSGLLTDENGTLSFDFYYDAGIDEATSDLEQQNKLASAIAGIKVFSIESYDNNSKSTGSISLKYYTDLVLTNSATLNVSPTVTDSSIAIAESTPDNFATAGFDVGFTTQEINDAQERNNVRYVFNENYYEQLQ
jgi:hypothetical protein